MNGKFLLGSSKSFIEGNIYANKASIILDWLLRFGIDKKSFSLRDVARACKVSPGLVQRTFGSLVLHGILQVEGLRTSKRFLIKKPELLLKNWLDYYRIVKKCKLWTYRSKFQNKEDLLKSLKSSNLHQKVSLALHSAAESLGYKNTNLHTLELYLLDPTILSELETILELEPQERGYEVLVIEPYYTNLLQLSDPANIQVTSPLLTFLDLYHFPLRGQEQAEFMAERIPELKRIYKQGL